MKKNDTLVYLKNHKIMKWLLFLAAFIGAVVVIVSVPKNIYTYINERLNTNQSEYDKIEKMKNGVSLEYVKSIFGEPTFKKKCEKNKDNDTLFYDCANTEKQIYKYTFDKKDYYLQVLTDLNDSVVAYTISLRQPSFKPKINVFLGRFTGDKEIKLGITKYSEFENIDDNFITKVDEQILGNNWGGFLELIHSDDYAVDDYIILESTEQPGWSKQYDGIDCDYYLLDTYKYDNNESSKLNNEKTKLDLEKFKNTCPIKNITVISNNMLGEKYWNIKEEEKNAYLKKQLHFFSID